MDLPGLVQEYGYIAVFIGSFLEGETVLLLAGYAAHSGYLSITTVIAVAFVASTLGDQLYFFLGRHWGTQLIARIPHWDARAERFRHFLHRHHTPIILTLRFIYGFRTVGAVVIGMSPVPSSRFVILNVIGAAIWSVTIGGAGYLLGSALQLLLEDLKRYEWWVAGTILVAGIVLWFWHRRRD